jgi:hypothetical protein
MPRPEVIHKILILGSGPSVIGQAAEFDYSGVQACKVLREEGYEVVLVNSNPATIMTDPEFAEATYVEPLLPGPVTQVIERERPDALLGTLGGQTALNLAKALHDDGTLERFGVELIGADYDFAIGAACFPETHIHADSAESDLRYLAEKVDAGVDFLITQMFFDNDFYFDFVRRARGAGVSVPIIPGVMPITKVGQVERMAKMCGSEIPQGLRKDKISGWRWLLGAWGVGTYRQNDSVDVRYEAPDGSPRVAEGLEIELG